MKTHEIYLRWYTEEGDNSDKYGNKFNEMFWGNETGQDEIEVYSKVLRETSREVKRGSLAESYDIEIKEIDPQEVSEEHCPRCSHGCNYCLMLES